MENKKTKLTISGNPKKSFTNFDAAKSQGKKTVVIEKKSGKSPYRSSNNKPLTSRTSSSNFKKGVFLKTNIPGKISSAQSDFERRKLAEQRATKRLKVNTENKTKNQS